jgi:hypothetical protein
MDLLNVCILLMKCASFFSLLTDFTLATPLTFIFGGMGAQKA